MTLGYGFDLLLHYRIVAYRDVESHPGGRFEMRAEDRAGGKHESFALREFRQRKRIIDFRTARLGWIFDLTGSYHDIWLVTIGLGAIAALMHFAMNDQAVLRLKTAAVPPS